MKVISSKEAAGLVRDGWTVSTSGCQGDRKTRGTGHFGHEGILKRIIGGHWGAAPRLGALAIAEKVEAYKWPQGVIAHLYRAIAGRKPGVAVADELKTMDARIFRAQQMLRRS